MKSRTHRITRYARSVTLAAVAVAAGSWSTASYACSPEPYMSAVCVLAWTRNDLRGYLPANGALVGIAQNSALFALLGTTYGGNGQTTFALPDLRGRTIIGAGTGTDGIAYALGQTAGSANVTLTQNQLPTHAHPLAAVNLSTVTATIDLSKVAGTAALTNVPFTADGSALRLRANSGNAGTGAPAGGTLAVPANPGNRIYSAAAPDVDLASTSISGAITVSSTATAPVTLPGSASVTLGGSIPAGVTGAVGANQAFSNMQPYLAMYYFIAVQGVFPSSN